MYGAAKYAPRPTQQNLAECYWVKCGLVARQHLDLLVPNMSRRAIDPVVVPRISVRENRGSALRLIESTRQGGRMNHEHERGSMQLKNCFHFHGHVVRQRSHANGAAGGFAGVAEDFDHGVAEAVHHGRMTLKVGC